MVKQNREGAVPLSQVRDSGAMGLVGSHPSRSLSPKARHRLSLPPQRPESVKSRLATPGARTRRILMGVALAATLWTTGCANQQPVFDDRGPMPATATRLATPIAAVQTPVPLPATPGRLPGVPAVPCARGDALDRPKDDACDVVPGPRASVYLVPHQDDELISMAGGIQADIRAHRDVWIVKFCRGDSSGTYPIISAKLPGLTRVEFSYGRDRELIQSAAALGIPADHVLLHHLVEAETDFPTQVDRLVGRTMARFGTTTEYHSMSFLDKLLAHASIGHALGRRCATNPALKCYYYISPLYQPGSPISKDRMDFVRTTWLPAEKAAANTATEAYQLWKPEVGRYAIGWASVRTQLLRAATHPGSMRHEDYRAFTPAERDGARFWEATQQSPTWWHITE